MTDVVVQDKDIIVEVAQPTIPDYAPPPRIGLVEINQVVQRGTAWMTGSGPPTAAGGQYGDMYLDVDSGDIYQWNGTSWDFKGTFAPATLTPAEILAALITVDGAGSGLDADLLDGQHGAYYAKQSDLDANTSHDTSQDAQIAGNTTLINNNSSAIATEKTRNDTQDTRLNAIEAKNTTQDTQIAGLAPISNPVLTGDPRAPTPAPGDNDTSIATTAFVASAISTANVGGPWAPVASPTFTGDPKAPTPSASDNDTSIATTQFVKAQGYSTLQDAPNDGTQYVRQSQTWAPVIVPAGTYVADSPPASPMVNQLWWKSNLGQLFIYYLDPGGAPAQWVQAAGSATGQVRNTARSRNRVNNPTAQVSQENGSTGGAASGFYPADQWVCYTSGITSMATRSSLSTPTPEGTTSCVVLTATVAKASLAAADYLQVVLPVEGLDVADLQWGTANAKPAVLRFCAVCDTVGTYPISLANAAGNRTWLGSFTITTASVPQVFSFAIPGDITGTWLKDTGVGVLIRFAPAFGSNYVGVAGWQAGGPIGMAGMTNLAAVANKGHIITDVGLYADPDSTGLPPPFVAPPYVDDVLRCKRYYFKSLGGITCYPRNGSDGLRFAAVDFVAPMRASPSMQATGLLNYAGGQLSMTPGGTPERAELYYDTTAISSTFVCQFLVCNARLI